MSESTPESVQWLTVSQAAAALGISARAVQKRCVSGKLTARRVATSGGDRWEVDGANLPANLDASRTRTREPLGREPRELGREQTAIHEESEPKTGANLDANPRTIGREQGANLDAPEVEYLREALQRERETSAREREIADQWRAQVEAANRQASEATAALREYLKISNRAIMPPANESAHNALDLAEMPQTGKQARPAANVAQGGTRREARPLWKVILGVR